MKALLDTCVWGGAKTELQATGHDVIWTGDLAQDPGDEEILAQANREQRVLVMLDAGCTKQLLRVGLRTFRIRDCGSLLSRPRKSARAVRRRFKASACITGSTSHIGGFLASPRPQSRMAFCRSCSSSQNSAASTCKTRK